MNTIINEIIDKNITDNTIVNSNQTLSLSLDDEVSKIIPENEFNLIKETLQKLHNKCNILIFNNKPEIELFTKLNKGSTTFIVDEKLKCNYDNNKKTGIKVYNVPYKILLKNEKLTDYFAKSNILNIKNLPRYVRRTKWDIIIIYEPDNKNANHLGLFQSIWEASILVNASNIFIGNSNNTLTNQIITTFLKDSTHIQTIGNMAHYTNSETKYILEDQQTRPLKKAVVSAIITVEKQRDELGPFSKLQGWDYHLFINDKTEIKQTYGWQVHTIPTIGTIGAHTAKNVKWMTHTYLPDYDIIIWVDAYIVPNIKCLNDFEQLSQTLVKSNTNFPLCILPHPLNGNIETEITNCSHTRIKKDIGVKCKNFLKSTGFPDIFGVYHSCMLIKNNRHPNIHKFGESMMDKIFHMAYRDQFWITYLLWRHKYMLPIEIESKLYVSSGKILNHNYVNTITDIPINIPVTKPVENKENTQNNNILTNTNTK